MVLLVDRPDTYSSRKYVFSKTTIICLQRYELFLMLPNLRTLFSLFHTKAIKTYQITKSVRQKAKSLPHLTIPLQTFERLEGEAQAKIVTVLPSIMLITALTSAISTFPSPVRSPCTCAVAPSPSSKHATRAIILR